MESAWNASVQQSGVPVAVIDTGVDTTHPELQGQIWQNTGEVGLDTQGRDKRTNSVDDDNDGYVDDWQGWDFKEGTNDVHDGFGHGTHIAGTIAALTNNNAGVAGICPTCKIMPLRIADNKGSLSIDAAGEALAYAADHGARVANASWGALVKSTYLQDMLTYAYNHGVLTSVAAGNSGLDVANAFPNSTRTMTVTAWDPSDVPAAFSNYGTRVDVAAPGVGILSLRAVGTDMYGDGQHVVGQQYMWANGTSMAAPHVTGLAALIFSAHPDYTVEQVRQVIRTTADDKGATGFDVNSGFGRINALRALSAPTPCGAKILSPESLANVALLEDPVISVSGVATCPSFKQYALDYGTGTLPNQWKNLTTSTTPVANGALFQNWDTSTLSPRGFYTLRLTVQDTQGRSYIDYVVISQGFAKLANFPKHTDLYGNMISPLIADVNADGVGDYVFDQNIFQASGNQLAGWPVAKLPSMATGGLGNFTNDPGLEYALSDAEPVRVYRANGSIIHGPWESISVSDTLSPLTFADIDRDGFDELIFSDGVHIHAFKSSGQELPGFPVLGGANFAREHIAVHLWHFHIRQDHLDHVAHRDM